MLKGANGDELKKVKHVLQYGIFAAYHLALETSFLADEGASLPELPLKSPITVALPDKPSSIERSISTIPGFTVPTTGNPLGSQSVNEPQKLSKELISERSLPTYVDSIQKMGEASSTCPSKGPYFQNMCMESLKQSMEPTAPFISLSHSGNILCRPLENQASFKDDQVTPKEFNQVTVANTREALMHNHCFTTSEASGNGICSYPARNNVLNADNLDKLDFASMKQEKNSKQEEIGSSKEEFPPSPSDHQSILVSLSTRCVWKGTVCERAHLFRIKYYGSFDKPLGRFLRDHLFDQVFVLFCFLFPLLSFIILLQLLPSNEIWSSRTVIEVHLFLSQSYRCRSCEMPSEAHVHCYTHRQGSLTISVKKLLEFLLPGEREGKIWMWHRCLRCPRINGFPPATRRVVMSDAAWGLSFGKFLELSFSNHAAASRVASCGHSLHRDCLRFYGYFLNQNNLCGVDSVTTVGFNMDLLFFIET